MELLIYFYDNILIYYPNVFFAILFFISILGIISVSIGIISLWKEVKRIIKEIKSNSRQKEIEKKKISFVQIINVFFAKNRFFFLQAIRIIFIRINTMLARVESRTEKIIKKIGKEILIEE